MPLQFNPIKLFSGSASTELAANVALAYGKELGEVVLTVLAMANFSRILMKRCVVAMCF